MAAQTSKSWTTHGVRTTAAASPDTRLTIHSTNASPFVSLPPLQPPHDGTGPNAVKRETSVASHVGFDGPSRKRDWSESDHGRDSKAILPSLKSPGDESFRLPRLSPKSRTDQNTFDVQTWPRDAPRSPTVRLDQPHNHLRHTSHLATPGMGVISPGFHTGVSHGPYPHREGYFPDMYHRPIPGPPSITQTESTSSGTVTIGSGPGGSQSPFSQAEHVSPNIQSRPGPAYHAAPLGAEQNPPPGARHGPTRLETPYPNPPVIPGSNSQQTFQVMTVQTASGAVQVPVDLQAASRHADEKRKRNAGASARFRQRRKKKEAEASQTIRKLEQKVKDLSEGGEFYRKERDYMANALARSPGGEIHFPRPPSPRSRRQASGAVSSIESSRGFHFASEEPEDRDGGRNVRRRTASLHEPPTNSGVSHHGASAMSATGSGPIPNVHNPTPTAAWPRLSHVIDASHRTEDFAGPHTTPSNFRPGMQGMQLPPMMQAIPPPTGPPNPYAWDRYERPWHTPAPRPHDGFPETPR